MIVEGSDSSKRRIYFSLCRYTYQLLSHSMNYRKSHSLDHSSQPRSTSHYCWLKPTRQSSKLEFTLDLYRNPRTLVEREVGLATIPRSFNTVNESDRI